MTDSVDTAATSTRNPPWSRDELILALDLYMTNPKSPPGKGSKAVADLSKILGLIAVRLGRTGTRASFRNEAGVYMKMMNFRRFDPDVIASGAVGLQRGNKDEEVVWRLFADDRDQLRNVAAAIKDTSAMSILDFPEGGSEIDDSEEAVEGRVLTRLHRTRERNRALVEKKKKQALNDTGELSCEACGFDYLKTYGERGRGFMEVHHTRPLHTIPGESKTKLQDLALVCANCHRMIHARRNWLSLLELRSMLVRS